jgi:hypothetical protein
MQGLHMMVHLSVGILLVIRLLAFPGSAGASSPKTYGPTSEVAHVVNAWDFQVMDAGDFASPEVDATRVCDAGTCVLAAGVRLPAGALATRIELDACDTSATDQITVSMLRVIPGALAANLATASSGVAATPGCARFEDALTTPATIDNLANSYILVVNMGEPGIRLVAVRVFYTLQVSPAPGAATFGDVPTSHPFFQFVQALVASGITAGCGGGNYCPDDPVTRGQMAVFLSKGLGLHFAP